jgi:hypothetical protein
MYVCGYCNKGYKKKGFFERHIVACEAIHSKSEDDLNEYIPSRNEMWTLMKKMMKTIEHQKDEINALKKHIQVQKRKINIIEWLEDNMEPSTTYSTFLRSITMNEYVYNDIIAEENIRIGLTKYIREHIFTEDVRKTLPIMCFKQFYNTFFIYDDDENWRKMTQQELEQFCNTLDTRLFGHFQEWKTNNQKRIDTCSKTNEYYMMIMSKLTDPYKGNNHEKHIQKIKSALYQHWNIDMKHAVSYEYEL